MGRGKSVGEETCPCGEGECGEREVCWRRDLSMRERVSVGGGESAGEETCPRGGGRAWGKIRNRIKSTQQRNGFK